MRLVDGEKIDRDFAHCGDDIVAHEPFRRDIEKPERAVVQAARHPSPLVVVEVIDVGGLDVVVSNAGNAPEGVLSTDQGAAALRASRPARSG